MRSLYYNFVSSLDPQKIATLLVALGHDLNLKLIWIDFNLILIVLGNVRGQTEVCLMVARG